MPLYLSRHLYDAGIFRVFNQIVDVPCSKRGRPENTYENFPVELHVNVTDLVLRCTSRPFRYCTAVAVAVALLPLRDADLLAMDQIEEYDFALTDELVQLEVPLP